MNRIQTNISLGLLCGFSICACSSSAKNTTDAGVQSGAGGASTGGSTSEGGQAGSATNGTGGATQNAVGGGSTGGSKSSTGGSTSNGGSGGIAGCIGALWGEYVQRNDGVLLYEGPSEQVIFDSTTGQSLSGVISVQNGNSHGCAAISDGSVQCWQTDTTNGNATGQLGNGTTTTNAVAFRGTPVLTAINTPLTNVAAVASGDSNSGCAVTNDNKLYCWGDLTWIVNKGTTLLSGYAQAITTDGSTPFTGVAQVALGFRQACALVYGSSANEVWCWGYNAEGELGQGDTTTRQYPTKVLGLSNPTWVVMSPSNSGSEATVCALDGNNVRCWGANDRGQVGVNSTTNPIQGPTVVVGQTGTAIDGVVDVEPGLFAFSILRQDGTIWLWGWGATDYAANYGLTNVDGIGWAGGYAGSVRYVTSDGIYHSAMTNVTVNCGAL